MNGIGRAMRTCRAARDLTREELAVLAGLSPAMVSLVERDKRELSLDALERVVRALDIPFPLFMLLASDASTIKQTDAPTCLAILLWLQEA